MIAVDGEANYASAMPGTPAFKCLPQADLARGQQALNAYWLLVEANGEVTAIATRS